MAMPCPGARTYENPCSGPFPQTLMSFGLPKVDPLYGLATVFKSMTTAIVRTAVLTTKHAKSATIPVIFLFCSLGIGWEKRTQVSQKELGDKMTLDQEGLVFVLSRLEWDQRFSHGIALTRVTTSTEHSLS